MNKWMVLILVLIMTTSGFADTVVLNNQKTFEGAWVVSFKTDPQQGAVVLGHIVEEEKLSDEAYPLTLDKIASVQFNWIGHNGFSTGSRQANMVLKDGKSYNGVSVSHAKTSNNSFGFYIRSADSQESSEFHFIPANTIESLDFIPANPDIEMCFNAELRNFYMRQGEHHWELNEQEKEQLNKMSAEEIGKIPGMTLDNMEKLLDNIFKGIERYAWNGMTRREYRKWLNGPDDEKENEKFKITERDNKVPFRRKPSKFDNMSIDDHLGMIAKQLEEGRMTGSNLQGLMDQIDTHDLAGDGYSGEGESSSSIFDNLANVGFLLLLLMNFLYLIPSILILKFICFVENIKDVSWKNLAICAVGLATVPLIITFPSYRYVLWVIPGYGGIFALLIYLFISRNIVMGSMEVFEGQAWMIVIVDLLIRIGLIIFFTTWSFMS